MSPPMGSGGWFEFDTPQVALLFVVVFAVVALVWWAL